MRKKVEILLPKTPDEIANGGVYRQLVRCGKNSCRCRRAEERHVAFYLIFRVGGKQRKKYIPRAAVPSVVAMVKAARVHRNEFRRLRTEALCTFRSIKSFVVSIEDAAKARGEEGENDEKTS